MCPCKGLKFDWTVGTYESDWSDCRCTIINPNCPDHKIWDKHEEGDNKHRCNFYGYFSNITALSIKIRTQLDTSSWTKIGKKAKKAYNNDFMFAFINLSSSKL